MNSILKPSFALILSQHLCKRNFIKGIKILIKSILFFYSNL